MESECHKYPAGIGPGLVSLDQESIFVDPSATPELLVINARVRNTRIWMAYSELSIQSDWDLGQVVEEQETGVFFLGSAFVSTGKSHED
jgi:hypothetical protein